MFVFITTSFLTALTAELDFPEMERPLPNFHHQFFQPLEPSLDFDTSSFCSQRRISQDSREFSKVLQKISVEEILELKIYVGFKCITPVLSSV